MRRPTIELEASQAAQVRAAGFCVLGQLTTAGELGLIRRIFTKLLPDGHRAVQEEISLCQVDMPVFRAPELVDTIFRANALHVARRILGETADWVGEQAMVKPPGGRETPWHQDEAYWSRDREYRALSIWMALEDVEEADGCLWFFPGSQRFDVMPHHEVAVQDGFPELEVDALPPGGTVACPLKAGCATLHLSRTLHYAGRNAAMRPRMAYVMGFACPPVLRASI